MTKQKLDSLLEACLTKEVYAQSRELERVENLGSDNEALKKVATHLRARLDQHLAKQAKVIHLLNQKIKDQNDMLMNLSTKMATLQKENESMQTGYDRTQRKKTAGHFQKMERLEEEIQHLLDKNTELKHFSANKEVFLSNVDKYQQALDDEKAAREANSEKLDQRNLDEKERLKKEMLKKIKETKLSLLAMTEDQLHSTTKRTIMENEQITTELAYQTREVDRLRRRNDKIEKTNYLIRKQMTQHSAQQNMLATRTRFFQKLIDKLKLQLDEQSRGKSRDAVNEKLVDRQQKRVALTNKARVHDNDNKIRMLEDKVEELSVLARDSRNATDHVGAELEASRAAARNMLELQEEAVTYILMGLEDAAARRREYQEKKSAFGSGLPQKDRETQVDPTAGTEIDFEAAKQVFKLPRHLKEMGLEDRETFLRMLLYKLNIINSLTPRPLTQELRDMDEPQY